MSFVLLSIGLFIFIVGSLRLIQAFWFQSLYIQKNQDIIKLVCFPTQDPYVIKLGIDASKNISIHREEIYESIQNQQQQVIDASNTV